MADPSSRTGMVYDLLLQLCLILLMVFMFLYIHDVPKRLLAKFRLRNRRDAEAKRRFVLGAQLLGRARSAGSRSAAVSMAKAAEAEANEAIRLDPRDAAAHILRALALDLQGFRSSALDSLDTALSPLAAGSLSEKERGDALFKRAELKVALGRRGLVDSAVDDLTRAAELSPDNAKAFCLLGECYEAKKMSDEARSAYQQALQIDADLPAARKSLDRLDS